MSWLYSRALVEAYSAANCSAGAPSAPLSATSTPLAFLPPAKMKEFSRLSRFGMTFAPLKANPGEELLTWFLADSRARTSAARARALASPVNGLGSGAKWRELWAKSVPHSSSLKTAISFPIGDWTQSSKTLRRSGMTVDGRCYPLPMSVLRTFASACGYLPTPIAHTAKEGFTPSALRRNSPSLLLAAIRWPTPHGFSPDGRSNGPSGNELGRAVNRALYPTPLASDATKWSNQSREERLKKRNSIRLITAVAPEGGAGGSLNPTWVEWLMGWPLGWTDCA